MSEERGVQPAREATGEHLLDFLERARALFRGKWFVLMACTAAASILLSLIDVVSSWSMMIGSLYTAASVVLPLILLFINLSTMFALIRRTDEGTLNARRKYMKFVFVLCVIGGAMIALSVLMLLLASLFGADSFAASTWFLILPVLAMYALILDYQRSLNGFYKNLYGATQGLYVKKTYAKRASYECICLAILSAALPYLLTAAIPSLGSFNLDVSTWDVQSSVSYALSVLNAIFTFLFFRQAEPIERSA